MGAYGLSERCIAQMIRKSPEALREQLWDDEWLLLGMDGLKRRLQNAERDAVRLYFEALEAVSGTRDQAVLILCGSLGVTDAEQLRRLVDFAKSSEGATVADARREAIRTLLTLQRSDPAERLRQRQELFGEIEAAEVVGLPALTNGHTNGPANGNGGGHVLDAR